MLKLFSIIILLAFAVPSTVLAGVTIHFEGTAKSQNSVTQILTEASKFSQKNNWVIRDASATETILERVINEQNVDYKGKVTGVVIDISENCEPIYIQFGEDLFMQDYVKTQFAGAGVHIQIIKLFESIRPHFQELVIFDEGEYWETRDTAILEGHISKINSMIEGIKKDNPKAQGPLRTVSGRIIDIIQ
ncbi:hypothetical protein [Desulfoluna spongiiphila]|uniref:Uncharacterized protein n=1 Tax=Desulfoluna spongiiphila TaxID=419481 RepID=A0A1G5FYI8_9BACT|nr:hypothetical protein [Desulfoluna spongiiphila]SCY44375.1 hypothetical protein SAMN05216233_10990 [Desulfoluna spongiiphila]